MKTTTMLSCAFGALVLLGANEASATVVEPSPAVYLLPASPGLAMGIGALITSVGTSVSLAETEAVPYGWSATAITFGALSSVAGGIYTALAVETSEHEEASRVFAATAVTSFTFGTSALVSGIVAAADRSATSESWPCCRRSPSAPTERCCPLAAASDPGWPVEGRISAWSTGSACGRRAGRTSCAPSCGRRA